ncbi:MAG TPA: glutaredoxin domain-containing protein [Polyangiaceae bacterium]|jgi:glutaredoxin-related protein|nr:glutaredoxin domain-containing protein [Polyangiaceae bacterium]
MQRPVLEESRIHPAIRDKVGAADATLAEVQSAIASNDVVVVGMKQNPHPKRARAALNDKGVPFQYLEYGSYFGDWRKRLTLKLWTGWPTFPMVFVKGVFVGGADEVKKLIDSGELDTLLKAN